MAKNSGIDWCDHTWNPWQGCRKVSPGCLNCYMYRDKNRYGQDPATVVRSKPATFNAPLKWSDQARVFVCSWSDFFIEDADAWREEAWEIMLRTPHLTYMLLTKRPENIADRLPGGRWPALNIWIGVTAENQEQADTRIPIILSIPAALRFVSVEPMISAVSFEDSDPRRSLFAKRDYLRRIINPVTGEEVRAGMEWVICGGESGPSARMMRPEWAAELKRQCNEAGVPFFMKQMSGKAPIPYSLQGREFPRSI